MTEEYERTELIITEFDNEDVITTSGIADPTEPPLTFKYSKYEGTLTPW